VSLLLLVEASIQKPFKIYDLVVAEDPSLNAYTTHQPKATTNPNSTDQISVQR